MIDVAKLIEVVYYGDKVYKPGDEVPADVAKNLTNPALWENGELPKGKVAEDTDEQRKAAEPQGEPVGDPAPELEQQPEPVEDEYEGMSASDLADEVKLRRERGATIDVKLNAGHEALLAALRANDAENA